MARFVRSRFDSLAGWSGAGHAAAFAAFSRSAGRFLDRTAKTGALGIDAAAFAEAAEAALSSGRKQDRPTLAEDEARAFFERHFVPVRILPDEALAQTAAPGFVTGYYEPTVDASPVETARFRYPLYARPDDLVGIDDVSRPPGMDASFRFARRLSCGLLTEYYDRAAIEAGALAGRGLEIAWLDDPVDAFFVHIQGSARLRYERGEEVRVGYAAKSGHPFTAIGRILVDEGELTLAEADMAGIRGWLADHPDRLRSLFDRNRSFIFFTARAVDDPLLGPVGAANVPLTPLGSIAVDRELATFGVPYFLDVPHADLGAGAPFRRLMIAQDTGSAILGPARADIFVGTGEAAGAIAGRIRHPADFHVLVPPGLADRLVR